MELKRLSKGSKHPSHSGIEAQAQNTTPSEKAQRKKAHQLGLF
jgi:hypothetical protein